MTRIYLYSEQTKEPPLSRLSLLAGRHGGRGVIECNCPRERPWTVMAANNRYCTSESTRKYARTQQRREAEYCQFALTCSYDTPPQMEGKCTSSHGAHVKTHESRASIKFKHRARSQTHERKSRGNATLYACGVDALLLLCYCSSSLLRHVPELEPILFSRFLLYTYVACIWIYKLTRSIDLETRCVLTDDTLQGRGSLLKNFLVARTRLFRLRQLEYSAGHLRKEKRGKTRECALRANFNITYNIPRSSSSSRHRNLIDFHREHNVRDDDNYDDDFASASIRKLLKILACLFNLTYKLCSSRARCIYLQL
ncbi:unnamed protein product [Trichogramma brassicae]|uniref:Uncharacterized protein n=1 Tax=Trichogramma brassicae TaxID=86971 RepID=A0A6H5J0F2_9HYME|nr:unnamed protein product [Trichogramma brassicae]